MLQPACIVVLHVKELLHSTVFINTHFSWHILGKLLNTLSPKVDTEQCQTQELVNPVPQIAYDYKLLQESLIGCDN